MSAGGDVYEFDGVNMGCSHVRSGIISRSLTKPTGCSGCSTSATGKACSYAVVEALRADRRREAAVSNEKARRVERDGAEARRESDVK